ncbi:MAG: hemolysin D [Gemmatimonadota bacterium]
MTHSTTRATRNRWVWAVGIVVIAAAALWLWRSRKQQTMQSSSTPATQGMQGMDGMAGMSMGADGAIALTADQLRTFGVTFGDAEVRTMINAVRAAGNVMVDETRIVQVTPRVGGFVERLHVNVTGQRVQRGQPLLELYSPELLAAQQELLLAAGLQRSLGQSAVPGIPDNTTDLVAAAKRRFQLWDVSEQQINEILRTGRTRRTMTLYAPASGVVTERTVVQGQSITPGEKLFTIADLSRVWVEADLRGADAASVRAGTTAEIEITGLAARSFAGRVDYVYPTLETDARTTRARIAVANTGGLLKPGMYATVRLSTPSRTTLTVPTSSVVRTGERAFVFVELAGGKLKSQDVELGRTAGDYTEVLAGIEPGQRVVTSAQFLLDSESNLGEVMKGMMGMGGDTGDMKGMDMKGADTKGMKGMNMNGKR